MIRSLWLWLILLFSGSPAPFDSCPAFSQRFTVRLNVRMCCARLFKGSKWSVNSESRVCVCFLKDLKVPGGQEEVQGDVASVWREGRHRAVLGWTPGYAGSYQEPADAVGCTRQKKKKKSEKCSRAFEPTFSTEVRHFGNCTVFALYQK